MWMVAIALLIVILFCLYSYRTLFKIDAKLQEKINYASDNFALQIAGREIEIKKQFIQESEHINPIVLQIEEHDIIAIISCKEKRGAYVFKEQEDRTEVGETVKKRIEDHINKMLNIAHYYLVLTNDNLHYLQYSKKGECKDHLCFERKKIENLNIYQTAVTDEPYTGETTYLNFEYENIPYKFCYYDKFHAHPSVEKTSLEELIKINCLFAIPFKIFTENIITKKINLSELQQD